MQLQITSTGRADWPVLVLVAAGFMAVAFYDCRLGVPRRALGAAATLGAIAVVRMVPAILPLLPAPSTLLPVLAETEPARQALHPIRTRARRTWRRANPAADGNDAEHGRPPG